MPMMQALWCKLKQPPKPRLKRYAWLSLLALTPFLVSCASITAPEKLQAVKFDASRYQGTWYELARLDNWFERGLVDVSAQYKIQKDGSVKVINRGFNTEKNQWKEAVGKAFFTQGTDTASLKVSFFGPFYGGYHVIALDPEYRWALVVGSDLSYVWILTREKTIDTKEQQMIVQKAQAFGIDTSKLSWITHSRVDPALHSLLP